ncbi:Hsp20/alpha crystallin family protein [Clostridium boliviensis]|uniref:Hsp20/alpha crystallin family protein n=1 Tax=Clostridium boliviensis TaxID=318465 RepID=A0ABU4GLV2_9CLOT|nr:Hsp20/alpha crystallin family protein [Clostridium boliviensis]MDW2798580.1 Hsp20/alpha crystallin family protein [Clostridium boliviensis]
MMMPSIFGDNLLSNWMDFPFDRSFFGTKETMKTDVREVDNGYELDIDLPGFKKEDIKARLSEGYLTITAAKAENKEEKDQNGRYIRRERYSGSMSRSFYVGNGLKEEDIHAKFENGILKLSVPKNKKNEIEQNNYISIEG